MRVFLSALSVFAFTSALGMAHAESKPAENVVGLLASEPEWLSQANDIAISLAHEDGLRVLPIVGAGGLQALQDLSQLQQVDAALVASDSLVYAQQQKLLNGKVAYVTRVAPLEVVLIARRSIGNVTALAGKKIATGPAQSSGFATGELLLNAFEIPFLRVPMQGENAIAALISGKADAALVLGLEAAKPLLKDQRFHILSLPLPPQLSHVYQAITLQSEKEKIETVSTSLVIAVHDWPRGSPHYFLLKHFDTELFKFTDEKNTVADVEGWTRHLSAQDALKKAQAETINPSIITPTGAKP
jgi:hypothetical protein